MDESKIVNEQKTLYYWRSLAKAQNNLELFDEIYMRYKKIAKGCTNKEERKAIATMCMGEIYRLLNFKCGFTMYDTKDGNIIGGQEIMPNEVKEDNNTI